MRIATAMRDVHYVLHAPQGDTYADLLFTMIERLPRRPPVTYTTFQARDLGGDTAELFKNAARQAVERFKPAAILVARVPVGTEHWLKLFRPHATTIPSDLSARA
jgi:light-independent protochlorophyllide reductase subunit B